MANKLRAGHMQYKKQLMKVKLSGQTLSRSAASALDFMREIEDPRFVGSEATSHFLRMVDQFFDRLKASNPQGVRLKPHISRNNLE